MKSLITTIMMLVLSVTISINMAQGQWTSIGPNGAEVYNSATYGNRMFVSTKDQSVFRSLDNGNSWELVYSVPYMDFFYISTIDVTETYVFVNIGWDVNRSTDNGDTWRYLQPPAGAPINIFKSIDGILYLGNYGGELYKSSNNGDNWTIIGYFQPENVASSFSDIVSFNSDLFLSDNNGLIYRSSNGGTNWTTILDSLNILNITFLESYGSFLFCNFNGHGIHKSSDYGNTWTYASNGLSNTGINSLKYFDSKLFAATNDGVFYSTNNGDNWINVSNGLPGSGINEIFNSGNNIFAGCRDQGIFKTTDFGNMWFEANGGFTGNTISSITSNNQYLFTGTLYGSLLRTSDDGLNWTSINNGITNKYISYLLAKDNFIFCATGSSGNNNMFRSSDNGDSWELINSGLLSNSNMQNITVSGNNIFAGSNKGIYFTSNNGENWIPKNNGLPGLINIVSICSFDGYIFTTFGGSSIYRSSNNGDSWIIKNSGILGYLSNLAENGTFIFAAGDKGIFRSSDYGESWVLYNNGITGLAINDIETSGNIIFASSNVEGYVDSSAFFYSNNNGLSWIKKNDGFNIHKRILNLHATNSRVFAGLRAESVWYINQDEFQTSQTVVNDVGVAYISVPTADTIYYTVCDSTITFNPRSVIFNYGTGNQSTFFNINIKIEHNGFIIYSDTKQDTLYSGIDHTVNFRPVMISGTETGIYKIKSWTSLQTDTVYTNDTSNSVFTIVNPNFGGGTSSTMGYYFVNSTPNAGCALNQPSFNWEDTTGSVSLISNGVIKVQINEGNLNNGYFLLKNILPQGTAFKFDGVCYDTFTVSTNGIIGLGSSISGLLENNPHTFPVYNPFKGPTLFPLWIDMDFGYQNVSGRNLKYKVTDNSLIITYDKAPISYNKSSGNYVSFQIILETNSFCGLNNGNIKFQYDDSKCGSVFLNNYYNSDLMSHIVGIQNITTNKSIIYRKGQNYGPVDIPGPLLGSPLVLLFRPFDIVLPVELVSLSYFINENYVTLSWQSYRETNNSGFDIERSGTDNKWSKSGFIKGAGNSSDLKDYSFTDKNLSPGKYKYRLKQIDFNGNFEYFNLESEVNIGIPDKYELSQNYPNPFNLSTKINYNLSSNGKVSIFLYDLSGREVATLVNEVKSAGYYNVNFSASNLSSGVYFYKLTAGDYTAVRRMVLLK